MLVLPRALGIIISHGIRLSLNDCQHLYVTLVGCIRVEIYWTKKSSQADVGADEAVFERWYNEDCQ